MASFFQNKVVAITGGSDGIGRALVSMLLAQGAKVATCGRNHDKLYQLQSEFPSYPLHTVLADVSSENDCRHFIDSTIKMFGDIDILINNAGISMRALLQDSNMDVLHKVMGVNFFGAAYCTKYALNSLIRRKGIVVGISSIAGYRGLPGRSAYSASKFALQGWLEAVKTELMDSGVHVMWVSPGFVTSNIRNVALNSQGKPEAESLMNEGKMMTPEACAQQILQAIEKRKRSLVMSFTGKETVLLNRFFPWLADKLVHRFYFKDGRLIK